MFQALNNLREKLVHGLRRRLAVKISSRRGQTAVVLIFAIALALIVYAASLNWNRITQYKTLTITASNLAAANMTSILASYGEQLLQVTLGGRPEYCKKTNFLQMLVGVIIAIVVLVVVVVTWGAAWPLLVIVIAALALAIASLVINLVIIQPGLTNLWNKMQDTMTTMEDKIVENGIMTAIQSTVTDPVLVQDHFDMDVDGLWVDEFGRSNVVSKPDKLSRLAYYYTMRLKQLQPLRLPEIDGFLGELDELVYDNPSGKVGAAGCTAAENAVVPPLQKCEEPDNFGLFDPGCPAGPSPYCNPCCVPLNDENGNRLRPASCNDAVPVDYAACAAGGAYPAPPYDFQYDPYYEEYNNTFYSFREKLGMDDEHMGYAKNNLDPNGPQAPDNPPPYTFKKKDSTGYYTLPDFVAPQNTDLRRGIYPFMWDMGNLALSMPLTFPAPIDVPPVPQIVGARKIDNVSMMTYNPATRLNKFKVADNMCALSAWDTDAGAPKGFWWKPGMDHYCSTTYPYFDCNRPGSCINGNFDGTNLPTCGCDVSSDKAQWHEDILDTFVDGLQQFIGWRNKIIDLAKNKQNFYNTFTDWYSGAAFWIAPKCDPTWNCDSSVNALQPQCSYCNNEPIDGYMIVWRDLMKDWVDQLDKWLYGRSAALPPTPPATFADPLAWCLPPAGTPLPSAEMNAIMSARPTVFPTDRLGTPMPPIWGDLNDTIACLGYNVNNAAKFDQCLTDCNTSPLPATAVTNCLNLPRSEVPMLTTAMSADPDYVAAQQYQDCLNSTCADPLTAAVLGVCQGFPALIPPSAAVVPANCAGWPANAFHTYVQEQRDAHFALTQVCTQNPVGTPTNFQLALQASRDAANLQVNGYVDPMTLAVVPGFQARLTELTRLRREALNARNVFLSGYTAFSDFLKPCRVGGKLGEDCNTCADGGPAAKLMCARQNLTNHTSQLSNFVIYGWKTPGGAPLVPRVGTNSGRGYWHIVRVETFAPKRCYGYCWTDELPKVKTWTKFKFNFMFGLPIQYRCYKLINTDGLIIARVTRYDEDRDSPFAKFANGQKIWNYRFHNPATPPAATLTTAGLEGVCKPPNKYTDGVSGETEIALKDAFMLNDNPDKDNSYIPDCWTQANALLATGVQTTTCARYYLDDSHMNLKFLPCPASMANVFDCPLQATTPTASCKAR